MTPVPRRGCPPSRAAPTGSPPRGAGARAARPGHRWRRLHRLGADRAPARPRLPRSHPRPPVLGPQAARAVPRPASRSSRPTSATCPPSAFDGVDGVINLAGLSNDPTAEYDPEANWQMNAIATETLGRTCLERDVERVVFASSCSLYDGLPPGMHDETAPIEPARRVRDLQALRRGGAAGARARRPVPGHLPQRHGLRLQPAHALRPRGQHVRQGRAAARPALAARRRLDVASAGRRPGRLRRDDRRPRGAGREGPRRGLQRPALELPDPRAGDAGGRLGAAARPLGHARGAPGADAHARLRVLEHQARQHARASSRRARWSRRSPASSPRSTSRTARC